MANYVTCILLQLKIKMLNNVNGHKKDNINGHKKEYSS